MMQQVFSKEQKLEVAYQLEAMLLDKCLASTVDKHNLNEQKVLKIIENVYGRNDIVSLQKMLGVTQTGKMDANTLKMLFLRLHKDSIANYNAKENNYAIALSELRRIIYPLIDDRISTPLLRNVKDEILEKFGVKDVRALQRSLQRNGITDYMRNELKVDGIFGKRTLFALLTSYEGQRIPKRALAEVRPVTTKGVIYLSQEDIDSYQLPETLPKEKVKEVLGVRYQWGGSDPKKGFDCSGLVAYMFKGGRTQTRFIYENSGVLVRNYNFSQPHYPLILSIPPREEGERRPGHAVIDYGIVKRDDKVYHVILQAGGTLIGKKGEVSLALVPEEVYRRVYGNFKVLESANISYSELFKKKGGRGG